MLGVLIIKLLSSASNRQMIQNIMIANSESVVKRVESSGSFVFMVSLSEIIAKHIQDI